jgi:hypothetical protein
LDTDEWSSKWEILKDHISLVTVCSLYWHFILKMKDRASWWDIVRHFTNAKINAAEIFALNSNASYTIAQPVFVYEYKKIISIFNPEDTH